MILALADAQSRPADVDHGQKDNKGITILAT